MTTDKCYNETNSNNDRFQLKFRIGIYRKAKSHPEWTAATVDSRHLVGVELSLERLDAFTGSLDSNLFLRLVSFALYYIYIVILTITFDLISSYYY